MRKIAGILLSLLFLLGGCSGGLPLTSLRVVGTTTTAAATQASTTPTTSASSAVQTTGTTASTSETPQATATTKTTPPEQTIGPEDVAALLSAMTTAQKVGQLFLVSVSDTTLGEQDLSLLRDCFIGNVILFGKNIGSLKELAALNNALRQEIFQNTGALPFLALDQEGGRVLRIADAALAPPAMAVAAAGSERLAQQLGELQGEQLRALGFHLNFAPCADVNTNPNNPVIGDRSYGETPETVTLYAAAVARGLQSSGVLACAKHFPGHGDTSTDSHSSLPLVSYGRDRLDSVELAPFSFLIDAGVAAVMVGHILYPALGAGSVPASLSSAVVTGLLRDEMGFQGLIVTDSLSMGAISDNYGVGEACVMAVQAGADLLCTNDSADNIRRAYTAVLTAVEKGEISEARLDASVRRTLDYKLRFGVLDSPPATAAVPSTEAYDALLREIARRSVTLLSGALPESLDGSKTLVVSTPSPREALTRRHESLGAYLTRSAGCVSTTVSRTPDTQAVDTVLQAAKGFDRVILAFSGKDCYGLATALCNSGVKVILCAMDSPYTVSSYEDLDTEAFLCLYEDTDYAIEAAAAALTGAAVSQ